MKSAGLKHDSENKQELLNNLMSWNGFPANIHKLLIERFENECKDKIKRQKDPLNNEEENEVY